VTGAATAAWSRINREEMGIGCSSLPQRFLVMLDDSMHRLSRSPYSGVSRGAADGARESQLYWLQRVG